MKTFFRTGAYRPPVMSMGFGIARMLLLFVCLLFATLHSDAETVKYGIKINGKEAQWGKKGTGWISNVRGYIEFTLDRMPKRPPTASIELAVPPPSLWELLWDVMSRTVYSSWTISP